jgi:hypothetical protein
MSPWNCHLRSRNRCWFMRTALLTNVGVSVQLQEHRDYGTFGLLAIPDQSLGQNFQGGFTENWRPRPGHRSPDMECHIRNVTDRGSRCRWTKGVSCRA